MTRLFCEALLFGPWIDCRPLIEPAIYKKQKECYTDVNKEGNFMENKKWKKILIAFMALLLLALPTAPALPFIKGTVITAEAASKKVSLSKKKLSLAIAGKTTVQLRNINAKRKITWSSSNKKIASVKKQADGKAVVTGNKAGKAVITAKYAGNKYQIHVTVKSPVLSKKSLTITAGKKTVIELKNKAASKKITWKSSKSSVASVKAGSKGKATITARKKGTAKITALYRGKKFTCTVKVSAPAPKLSVKSKTLYKGRSFTLELKNASSSVKWSTSNKKIAAIKKISKNKYKVTAKKAGTAKITAKTGGKTYTCKITVKNKTGSQNAAVNPGSGNSQAISQKYTYDLRILNRYTLYSGVPIIVYVKTKDPAFSAADLQLEKGKKTTVMATYADVRCLGNYEPNVLYTEYKVAGGYLVTFETDYAGENTLLIRGGNSWNPQMAAKKEITVHDFKQAEQAWLKKIIAQETNRSMTADEKMTALANYVRKNFKYTPNYNGAVVDLVSKKGAYFENYIADCITATNIMCRFANLLGLKSQATYAGYLNHYYATVWIGGKAYTYDASPLSETGALSRIDYVL